MHRAMGVDSAKVGGLLVLHPRARVRFVGKDIVVFGHAFRPATVDWTALKIIQYFSEATSVERAYEAHRSSVDVEFAKFQQIVLNLVGVGILCAAQECITVIDERGFGSAQVHHRMLRDFSRVMSYREAILRHARDKVVVEIGCGTGILSVFAAQAGARKVYAIERSGIASVAQDIFRVNGVEESITLLRGESSSVTLPERAHLLIHELIGIDPFDEDMLRYIADGRERFLLPGGIGRVLPRFINVCCVGIEVTELRRTQIEAEAREFSTMYGLDFSPYIEALRSEFERCAVTWRYSPRREYEGTDGQKMLSEECTLRTVDLESAIEANAGVHTSALHIRRNGELGALLLFVRIEFDRQHALSTSPWAPLTHWGCQVHELPRVRPVTGGERLELASYIVSRAGRQSIRVEIDG